MTSSRDVLVVVPTRGERRDLLDISVRSLAAQTWMTRVLVITTSDPGVLVERWRDLPTVVVIGQQSRGLSAAINEAWEHDGWRSTYTGWLGDDDALPPWSVQTAVAALDARPAVTAVHGPCLVVDEGGHPVRVYRNGRIASALVGYGINLVPQPGSLFRTSAVRAVGGLDPSLTLAMDVDLFARLRAHGPIGAVTAQLGVFREHTGGLSTAQADAARAEALRATRRLHHTRLDTILDRVAAALEGRGPGQPQAPTPREPLLVTH